jgi:dUTP pyrophosphatase
MLTFEHRVERLVHLAKEYRDGVITYEDLKACTASLLIAEGLDRDRHLGPSVKFKRLPHAGANEIPRYATEDAAAMDLRCGRWVPEPEGRMILLSPGIVTAVPTGFQVEIPKGFEGQIRARSGLALKHGVMVANGIGTIDSDYRGELVVLLTTLKYEYVIPHGERIAQFVIAPAPQARTIEVQELTQTARGEGGFGSTGSR